MKEELVKKFPKEKMLKIRVLSAKGDKANITLPIKVIKTVVDATGELPSLNVSNMEEVQLKEINAAIVSAIENDIEGKIIDVRSAEGDVVEITIE